MGREGRGRRGERDGIKSKINMPICICGLGEEEDVKPRARIFCLIITTLKEKQWLGATETEAKTIRTQARETSCTSTLPCFLRLPAISNHHEVTK